MSTLTVAGQAFITSCFRTNWVLATRRFRSLRGCGSRRTIHAGDSHAAENPGRIRSCAAWIAASSCPVPFSQRLPGAACVRTSNSVGRAYAIEPPLLGATIIAASLRGGVALRASPTALSRRTLRSSRYSSNFQNGFPEGPAAGAERHSSPVLGSDPVMIAGAKNGETPLRVSSLESDGTGQPIHGHRELPARGGHARRPGSPRGAPGLLYLSGDAGSRQRHEPFRDRAAPSSPSGTAP